jgi:hypothetical protein
MGEVIVHLPPHPFNLPQDRLRQFRLSACPRTLCFQGQHR